MTDYFDTSALAKLGLREAESKQVENLLRLSEVPVTSLVTRAELTSALHRAVGRGDLPIEAATAAREQFGRVWRSLGHVPVTAALIERAEMLVWTHRMRGFDGVHLASALSWQERVDGEVRFCTFDRILWRAARDEGLDAWPPAWGD